jgi:hypothetical protein
MRKEIVHNDPLAGNSEESRSVSVTITVSIG